MMRKMAKLALVAASFPLAVVAGAVVAVWVVFGLALYGYAKTFADIWRGT